MSTPILQLRLSNCLAIARDSSSYHQYAPPLIYSIFTSLRRHSNRSQSRSNFFLAIRVDLYLPASAYKLSGNRPWLPLVPACDKSVINIDGATYPQSSLEPIVTETCVYSRFDHLAFFFQFQIFLQLQTVTFMRCNLSFVADCAQWLGIELQHQRVPAIFVGFQLFLGVTRPARFLVQITPIILLEPSSFASSTSMHRFQLSIMYLSA